MKRFERGRSLKKLKGDWKNQTDFLPSVEAVNNCSRFPIGADRRRVIAMWQAMIGHGV